MDEDRESLGVGGREVIGRIAELTNLLSEMEENDKLPDEDRARMQAELRKQIDDARAFAVAHGYLDQDLTDPTT